MKEALKEKTVNERVLQWHSAFYASIQIELEEETDKLIFIREYHQNIENISEMNCINL